MFVKQGAVSFAQQNPAIFMPEPGCDGHKVDPRHDTYRAEIMAQIMKADPFEAGRFARDLQTFTKTLGGLIAWTALWRREEPGAIWSASRAHFAQKRSQLRIEFDSANFPIFRKTVGADSDTLAVGVHVRPFYPKGFLFSRATERKKAQIIDQLPTVLFTGVLRGREETLKFRRRNEIAFRRRRFVEHLYARKLAQMTILNRGFEDVSKSRQIEISSALRGGLQLSSAKNPTFQTLIDKCRDRRRRSAVDTHVTEMIAPARERLAFTLEGPQAFTSHFRFVEIRGAIVDKKRF